MTMRDWIAKVDDFLRLSDRDLLTHAGTISHDAALAKAQSEFDKFRLIKDAKPQPVDIDFENAIQQAKQVGIACGFRIDLACDITRPADLFGIGGHVGARKLVDNLVKSAVHRRTHLFRTNQHQALSLPGLCRRLDGPIALQKNALVQAQRKADSVGTLSFSHGHHAKP